MKDKINLILNGDNNSIQKMVSDFSTDEAIALLDYVSRNYDNQQVKKIFTKLSSWLPHTNIIGNLMHPIDNIKLKIYFVYYICPVDALIADIITTIKNLGEQESDLYEFIILNFDLSKLLDAASKQGLQIPNNKMLKIINQDYDLIKNKKGLFRLLMSYQSPNQIVYNLLKRYLVEFNNQDDFYVALNSVNAPFEYIFDNLISNNCFPKNLITLYEFWIKNNDFRAFLLSEYLYIHNIEISLHFAYSITGLLENVLRNSNLNNYYLVLNYWRLSLPDKMDDSVPLNFEFIKIYTKKGLNEMLSDYVNIGSQLDEEYLKLTALHREENRLKR